MMPLTCLPVGLVSVSAAFKQWSDNPDSVAIKTFSKPAREAIQSCVPSKAWSNWIFRLVEYVT